MRQFHHVPVDDFQHAVLQTAFGITFFIHANGPNVAWYTLRSAALRLLPRSCSQGAARIVGLGDVSSRFSIEPPKSFPFLCGSLGTTSWGGPGLTVRAASLSVALLVASASQ